MINYYLLTKPGIIFGNLITLAAGFLLASKGRVDVGLFFATLLGLAFIIASACVFNNYIDRNLDQKMERTKNRILAKGAMPVKNALVFGAALAVIGSAILLQYTNYLAYGVAAVGFFVYVLLYSLWKGKTIYGTAIGSVAGAVPPVVGYCAASNSIDGGAVILFIMLVLWQMPHFFSIALYHIEDYTAAKVPVLPIIKGIPRAKIHMVLYVIAFLPAAMMLTYFGYAGYFYLSVMIACGAAWIILSLKGFQSNDDKLWGKQMFRFSLLIISFTSLVIPLDQLLV